ncbi:MAG: sialate O-acetylesterase [Verrucomicrobium sp.]
MRSLCLLTSALLLSVLSVPSIAVEPPQATIISSPGAAYSDTARVWQGIPGIERAPKGRLWAAWYSGDIGEGMAGNYALVASSGNEGKSWSKPVVVIEGPKGTAIVDPLPWLDPQGRLWVFYKQVTPKAPGQPDSGFMGTFAIRTDEPDLAEPKWSAPMLIGEGGTLFGKPLVLPDGRWLAPFFVSGRSAWKAQIDGKETGVVVSADAGVTWYWQGGLSIAPELRNFSEATLAPRKDGTLLMAIRTQKGLYESTSADQGRTWTPGVPMGPFGEGPATRACLMRLNSGAFLLVYHDPVKSASGKYQRSRITAWLSDDEGRTWPFKLLLNERQRVSYPDAIQAADGRILVAYDLGRYEAADKAILLSVIREEDIRAGKLVNASSKLNSVVSRAYAYGNHGESSDEVKVAQVMPKKESFDLYLLIGQSNMAGRGSLSFEDRLSRDQVLKFSARNAWAPGVEPLHTDKPGVAGAGIGMSFAREMVSTNPKVTVGLIPCAVGGTPLERWVKGGDLYQQALVRAREAMKSGSLKGILWHQGEADSGSEEKARSYAQRLSQLVKDLRTDLGAGEVPFVAGKLGEFLEKENKEGEPSFWPVVNEQIATLPALVPNTAVVDSSGLKHKGDGVHFDTRSLREFGNRYAAAMKELQEKQR